MILLHNLALVGSLPKNGARIRGRTLKPRGGGRGLRLLHGVAESALSLHERRLARWLWINEMAAKCDGRMQADPRTRELADNQNTAATDSSNMTS